MIDGLHLLEPMYDRWVEFMLESEMPFEVAMGSKCFWAERTVVASRKMAEEPVEVKVTECGHGELTVSAAERREVAHVYPHLMEQQQGILASGGMSLDLFYPLPSRGIGCVFVDKMCFKVVSVFE
jgi:hypothetical protein